MKLMLQFGKVQLQGSMRSIEYSSQGVWVAEVPPCHPCVWLSEMMAK